VNDDERRAALEAVAAEVRDCSRCRLHAGRTQAVPGEGSAETEVVFVGEGPGANEDQQGRPFVGAAGGLLTELLGAIGWRRQDVFITNVVKCRPPGNRDPEPDEIAACAPYLRRQLEALDPALVITLGRFSLQAFMPGARIGSAHGAVRPVDPASGAADALALALYHPAAAFRQAGLRNTLFEDMTRVPDALIRSREARAAHAAAHAGLEPGGPAEREPAAAPTASAPATAPEVAAPLPATGSPGEPAPAVEPVPALVSIPPVHPVAVATPSVEDADANQLRFF
jgi:uracil-DNA glycosylase family 4